MSSATLPSSPFITAVDASGVPLNPLAHVAPGNPKLASTEDVPESISASTIQAMPDLPAIPGAMGSAANPPSSPASSSSSSSPSSSSSSWGPLGAPARPTQANGAPKRTTQAIRLAQRQAHLAPFGSSQTHAQVSNWTDGLGECLILMHSGELVQRYWRKGCEAPGTDAALAGRYSHRVVTHNASEHLFEEVVLHPAVTLRSVFAFLKSSPALVKIFKRLQAQSTLEAALKAQERDPTGLPVVDLSEVEFIALHRPLQRTAEGGEIQGIRLRARGVGFIQNTSLFEGGYLLCRAGGRVEHDISQLPLRSLLNAPLRLDASVYIGSGDQPATQPGLDMVCVELQLGELITALLSELLPGSAGKTVQAGQADSPGGLVAPIVA